MSILDTTDTEFGAIMSNVSHRMPQSQQFEIVDCTYTDCTVLSMLPEETPKFLRSPVSDSGWMLDNHDAQCELDEDAEHEVIKSMIGTALLCLWWIGMAVCLGAAIAWA